MLHPAPRASRFRLAAAMVALLLAAAPLAAQNERTTVTGRVRDVGSGAPVAGVTVAIPSLGKAVLTDSTGAFAMPGVRLGSHRWVITRLGYVPLDEEMEVVGDDHFGIGILSRPLTLERLTVTVNRAERTLARRRNGSGQSVRYIQGEDLARAAHGTAAEFVKSRAQVYFCDPAMQELGETDCVSYRGQRLPVTVYIDEERAYGGLLLLTAYAPSELYAVELWRGGSTVRVYTNRFIGQLARDGRRLAINPW